MIFGSGAPPPLGYSSYGVGGAYGGAYGVSGPYGGAYRAGYAGAGLGGAGYGYGYNGAAAGGECCSVNCGDTAGGAGVGPYGPGGINGNGYAPGVECCGVGCGDGGGGGIATMSYVGGGGDYMQETSYKYVGAGAGTFSILQVPTGIRRNYCCCIIPLLLLLLLLPLLYMLLSASSVTTTFTVITPAPTPAPTPPPPTAPPVVPTTLPPTTPAPKPTTTHRTTTKCPFDCNAGYNDLGPLQWVKGWSGEKKIYCCHMAQRGCPSQLPPPSGLPQGSAPPEPDTFQYDCVAGYHNCPACLIRQWSPAKIAYCCRTQGKGCDLPHPR